MRINAKCYDYEYEIDELLQDLAYEQEKVWCLGAYGVLPEDLYENEYELADADAMYRVFLDRLRSKRNFPLPPRSTAEPTRAEEIKQLREELRQESLEDPEDGQAENPPRE